MLPGWLRAKRPQSVRDHWSGSEQLRQYFHLSPGAWRLVRWRKWLGDDWRDLPQTVCAAVRSDEPVQSSGQCRDQSMREQSNRKRNIRTLLFEDDAGRAEDERTGLTCAARQAALASQCRSRCAVFAFASNRPWCFDDPNRLWHNSFGDISGDVVGSARIEGCGPPLRDGFFRRVGRSPPPRLHP